MSLAHPPNPKDSASPSVALRTARGLLTALLYANAVYGLSILGLLVASIVVPGPLFEALGVRPAGDREVLEGTV